MVSVGSPEIGTRCVGAVGASGTPGLYASRDADHSVAKPLLLAPLTRKLYLFEGGISKLLSHA